MAKKIHIHLGPVVKVHAAEGDTVKFETEKDCTIKFDDESVFGVLGAATTNRKLEKTVLIDRGRTSVSMAVAAAADADGPTANVLVMGHPTEIIVP